MENKKITRTVMFDRNLLKDEEVYSALLAVKDWYEHFWMSNVNDLRKLLGVEHLPPIILSIKEYEEKQDDSLRILVYKTKECHISEMSLGNNSHMIQISITQDIDRNGWINGELSFSAKVFAKSYKDVVYEVEDVLTDILMFYIRNLNESFDSIDKKREFSSYKVEYIKSKKLNSYIGIINDPEYVSFASFCRLTEDIDYNKYISLWDDFLKWLEDQKLIKGIVKYYEGDIQRMLANHPKGMQISPQKLRKIITKLDAGEYMLIRTDRKPRDKRMRCEIMSRFGMKKWKTGRIKIEKIEKKYTWLRLKPYVSMFVFQWGKCV